MENIVKIIKQLEGTPGTNDKIAIIKDNANNEKFVKALQYTYSDDKMYGFSEDKLREALKYFKDDYENTWVNGFDMLDILASSNINDILRRNVYSFILSKNEDEQELWIRILTKDLRCKISGKTINKAIPNCIFLFSVMLADKYLDKIKKLEGNEFIITQKLDGARFILIKYANGNVRFFTRKGQEVDGMSELIEDCKFIPCNTVIDGEVLLNKQGLHSKDLYRETMKEFRKKGEKKGLRLHAFDILPYDEFIKGKSSNDCKTRKITLHNIIEQANFTNIVEVPIRYIGKDMSKINEFLNKAIENDEEGIMVNIANAPYETKRTANILKVKKFQDGDMRVINLLEGTGNNKGKLGSITVQFKVNDEIHSCDCGSGFTDEERVKYWNNKELLLNKIVTIGYFEISQNSKTKEYGLRFPTWKGIIREDKDEISMY